MSDQEKNTAELAPAAEPSAPPDETPDETPDEARDAAAEGADAAESADAAEPEAETPETDAPEAAAEPDAEPDAETLAAALAEVKDQLLRALAEGENIRRRAAAEREEVGKYAITALARDVAPVLDNLRRALDSVPDDVREDDRIASFVAGVEMTEREFLGVLERHRIRRIDPLGEKFDHHFHQAVFEVEDSDAPAGTVVKVVQAGYVIAGRLLRPAMVGVSKGSGDGPPQRVDTEA